MSARQTARFIASGALAAGAYCIFMTELADRGLSPMTAGAAAYLACMPIAFFLHKLFTFRSNAPVAPEAGRFMLTSLIGIVIASITPHVMMTLLDSPAWLASIGASIITPAISYLLMSSRVFYMETHD
jgi:putative flippase GtrA